MSALISAYILVCVTKAKQFADCTPPLKAGVEITYEPIGPQGTSEAECNSNGDRARKLYAIENKVPSYMMLKYKCIVMPLSTK